MPPNSEQSNCHTYLVDKLESSVTTCVSTASLSAPKRSRGRSRQAWRGKVEAHGVVHPNNVAGRVLVERCSVRPHVASLRLSEQPYPGVTVSPHPEFRRERAMAFIRRFPSRPFHAFLCYRDGLLRLASEYRACLWLWLYHGPD